MRMTLKILHHQLLRQILLFLLYRVIVRLQIVLDVLATLRVDLLGTELSSSGHLTLSPLSGYAFDFLNALQHNELIKYVLSF